MCVCELVIGELTDLVSVGVLWRPTPNRLIGSLCVAFDANDARALVPGFHFLGPEASFKSKSKPHHPLLPPYR